MVNGRQQSLKESAYFAGFGSLSLLLGLDDVLLLHEGVLPRLGIPELAMISAYPAGVAALILALRRNFVASDYPLLVAALCSLASPGAMDTFLTNTDIETFAEDSLKFVGITFWLAYGANTVASTLAAEANARGSVD